MSIRVRLTVPSLAFAAAEYALRALVSRSLAASCALLACLVGTGVARADPSSFSESLITDTTTSTPPESIGTTSSSVSQGGNTAGSFVFPATETIGGVVRSDGTVFGVSTTTTHNDDWTCGSGASCDVMGPLIERIQFDATFSTIGIHEFTLAAQYRVGGSVFSINVGEDGGMVGGSASWGGDPVEVALTPDATGITHVSTSFVGRTTLPSCSAPCPVLFSDQMMISIEMEGNGFVDASHTFSVSLAPEDPAIFLTSADGRTAGSPVAQVPEPGTFALLGAGLATLAGSRRRKR